MSQSWRKSSRSAANGNCLEVAWRKSSRSVGNGACVEAADGQGVILVRDSKNPDGGVLSLSTEAWREFTRRIKRDAQA